MDPFDDNSLSTNILSISVAYFSLFLLIDRTKGHKLFNNHLLYLRAELPIHRWQKKVIYFLPCRPQAGIAWERGGNVQHSFFATGSVTCHILSPGD